jgi:hypothetical protein
MTIDDFFRRIDSDQRTALERAYALLWWTGMEDPTRGMNAREICDVFERNGHPSQNASRLHAGLANSKATAKVGRDAWRLHPRSRKQLDQELSGIAGARVVAPPTDSVLPREMFHQSRGYLEKVVQ